MKMINEKLQMLGNASGASLKYEGAQAAGLHAGPVPQPHPKPHTGTATNKIKQHVAKIPNLTLR